jgi:hypothetical protein
MGMRRNNRLGLAVGVVAAFVIGAIGCTRSSEASIEKADSRSATSKTNAIQGDPADTAAYGASMGGVGDCKVNEECKVALRLKAKGDFHINKEYPTKFSPAAADGVEYVGGGTIRFTASQEKDETFLVTIKRTSGGAITPKGVFKFGVCRENSCQVAAVELSATIS